MLRKQHLLYVIAFFITSLIFLANSSALLAQMVSPATGGTASTSYMLPHQIRNKVSAQPDYGFPVENLHKTKLGAFNKGRAWFEKDFMASEGAGPMINNQRCSHCHFNPAVGGFGSSSMSVTRFGQNNMGVFDPLEHLGGSLLQNTNIFTGMCIEVVPPEANVVATRLTTPLFGLGLVEAIADADIAAGEILPPPNVSGRVHWVEALEGPVGTLRAGRFGWKSQLPTLLSFSADAANNEIGLTNALLPLENVPNGPAGDPTLLALCDDGVADPDDQPDSEGVTFIERVTDFQKFLAPPPQAPTSITQGELIFNNVGCVSCHTRSFTTSSASSVPAALRNKEIRPYSDFLLHDMGSRGDGIGQGDAQPTEMRTTPLWGLRQRAMQFASLWHDGSVFAGSPEQAVEEAILAHGAAGSEAAFAVNNYNNLSQTEKNQLIEFLFSLGRFYFDDDGNDVVDLQDLPGFQSCYNGSQNYGPDHPCAIHDADEDQDVDARDVGSLAAKYPGPVYDCQCDGNIDLLEVLNGAPDIDGNFSPDQCNISINIQQTHVFVWQGQVEVGVTIGGLNPGTTVDVFYSYQGQGNGGPYGDSACLNLKAPTVLGSAVANQFGFASLVVYLTSPPNPGFIYLQAGILNGGTGSQKSNVVKRLMGATI